MKTFLAPLFVSFLFLCGFSSNAQIFEPVKWKTDVEDLGDDTYNLIMTATIDDGWYLYSQTVPDGGPIATLFTLESEEGGYELIGETAEEEGKTKFDKVFEMELTTFTETATFTQKIKRINGDVTTITGTVDFQSCDDEKCIFEMADLEFELPKGTGTSESQSGSKTKNKDSLEADDEDDAKGLWAIFFIAFLSGFAALLTPCVFPMIPLTVSFFTKQSKNKAIGIKNAILYGVFIIVIYVLLGSMVTAIFGSDVLNELSTSVWFNVVFFLLLVVFAISFLGAFEITLPQSWANKVDSKASKGGIVGIFFMALALAIVSFSCTGPIVGGLLVEAASKGGIAPIVGMLGFSLAIALPFTLFAIFPGWLNSLPKSGGWLNTVKVVLGFLELAFAFKFLSQADLVLQLHLLEREVFIAIWIAIFGALSLYLLGKIRLPHDGPLTHISVGRLLLGLLTLSFVIYMLPGLWGAPLQLISAFPPPLEYSEAPYGVGYTKLGGGATALGAEELPDGGHLMAPHDILHFYDYEKGLKYAKEVNKPVMIDFTGWACVNCRKMEQNVWPEPGVLNILKNEVVLISLYVDDKRELPEDEKYVSPETGKKIKTIGNKWSDLQIVRYKANAQPYYVLMGHDEQNLVEPEDYTPDAEEYEAWLKSGIEAFKNN
ncbi:protein-disulfide reductase DsbD family protein [Marinirhabdus gelatinilytica]|uniref:Thiol:disulfide interchange protein DsbD n=1 Tax=Marinirhabdus gelatinilytica TaxID=1703343 RepID=A0A370QF63_9FLAO|nr:thioredoxin family protein [Marinirhabdus gelatinilytica]RDK87005.1 thiol:disulfide interchange protein DsbD [Marinirhabdus gelatinilytica]